MRRVLFPLILALSAVTSAAAEDLPMADAPPPLRDAGAYVTHVERAVFNGPRDAVIAYLQAEDTGVLAHVTPTERIPAVLGTTPLDGHFPDPGATRRVNLAGGHHAVERVLQNADGVFAYQVWNFTAPRTGALSHIRGEFRYVDLGDRTEVIWTYAIAPRMFLVRPFVRSFLRNDFAPFMAAGLSGAAAAFNAEAGG